LLAIHSVDVDKAESVAHVIVAIEEYAARLVDFAELMNGASARLRIALRSRPDMQALLELAGAASDSVQRPQHPLPSPARS
jgi:hypothetical protein